MTTTIYLIRHGEVFNPNGIVYGRLPHYGLSLNGKMEIEQTGIFLKNKNIDVIYSSPLLRARQTAEIIRSKLGLPKIFLSKYILEVRTDYQGKLFSELAPDQSDIYEHPYPNDEILDDIAKRMQAFIKFVIKKHPGKKIVAVSHGDPLMLLRAVESGLPAEYASVREGKGFTYLKHGEVIELAYSNNKKPIIKSLFTPSPVEKE